KTRRLRCRPGETAQQRQNACSPVTGVSMASARKRPARFLFDRPKIKLIGKVVLPVFKRVVNWLKDERGDVPQNLVVVALWTAAGIVLVSLIGQALYGKANDLIEDISNIDRDIIIDNPQ